MRPTQATPSLSEAGREYDAALQGLAKAFKEARDLPPDQAALRIEEAQRRVEAATRRLREARERHRAQRTPQAHS